MAEEQQETVHNLDPARIVRGFQNTAGYWRNLFGFPNEEDKKLSDDPQGLIPDPEAEVMAHVAVKCAQIGAGVGLIGSSLAALAMGKPNLYRKALSPTWSLGGLFVLTPVMWYGRMVRGNVDYEGFLDRAYRIRFNQHRCALTGAAIGGVLGPIQGLGMSRGLVFGFLAGTFGAGLYNNFEAIEHKVVGRPDAAKS